MENWLRKPFGWGPNAVKITPGIPLNSQLFKETVKKKPQVNLNGKVNLATT